MSWFKKPKSSQCPEAEGARQASAYELARVRGQWPFVHYLTSLLQHEMDTNHFGEAIVASMRGKK